MVHASVPGRVPVALVVQLDVSVPVDQCSATAVLFPQLPPDTEMAQVVVAVTRSHEFGEALMNGVGVMESVPRTPPPPAVHVRGTAVGAVAPGDRTVRFRVSGAVAVNVASFTVTVPLAPAVSVPTWLPVRTATGAAGKVAGAVKVPVTARPKLADAVPPVAVNGTVPENEMMVPADANAWSVAGIVVTTPSPVSAPFSSSAAVVPAIDVSGTSAGLAARLTGEPELTGLGANRPSTATVGRLSAIPPALHVSAPAGVSAAATPAVRLLTTAADATVRTLATGKAAMRTRSLRPLVDGFIVSSLLEPSSTWARSPIAAGSFPGRGVAISSRR
jgi:hypothetical protein